jgi:excisionase family DNA binding protein
MTGKLEPDRPCGGKPAMAPKLIDVRQFAQLLGVSTRHVRRMSDAGKLPQPVRIGGSVRWRVEHVEGWIADGCPSCRHGAGRGAK